MQTHARVLVCRPVRPTVPSGTPLVGTSSVQTTAAPVETRMRAPEALATALRGSTSPQHGALRKFDFGAPLATAVGIRRSGNNYYVVG